MTLIKPNKAHKFYLLLIIFLSSCSNNEFKNIDILSVNEASELLIMELKKENYRFVENYFDHIEKNEIYDNDGVKKIYSIYQYIYSKNEGNEEELLKKWCSKSSRHIPYVIIGNYYIHDGWRYRGDKYANETSNEQFRNFYAKLKLAKESLEKAYNIYKKDMDIYCGMMTICMALSQREEFEFWYTKSLDIDKTYFNIYHQKFTILLPKWGGSWKDAYNFAKKMKDNSPKGSKAYCLYLELILEYLYNLDKYSDLKYYYGDKTYTKILQDVAEIENRLLSEFPSSEFMIIKRERIKGSCYFMLGDTEEAEKSFKRIIEFDSNYHWAWYMLGQMYTKSLKKYKDGIKFYNKAIELYNDYSLYHFERGYTAYCDFDVDLCISDMSIALKKNIKYIPQIWMAYFYRGICLQHKGKNSAAIEDFTSAITENPEYLELFKYRSWSYHVTGQLDKAISDLRHILKSNPQDNETVELLKQYESELQIKRK